MAKPLSRLISPQRAKTDAKRAQNAAYNQAQIAAQSGQAMPQMAQGVQPFSRRQMTDLKHQQNARFNQDVLAGNVAAPTFDPAQMTQRQQMQHNQNSAYNEAQVAAAQPAQQEVGIGQFEQAQQTGNALGQSAAQPVAQAAAPVQPKPQPQMYRQSPGVYSSRPAPQQPRFRQSPGVYGSRPAPTQNATPRPVSSSLATSQPNSWMRRVM